MTVPGISPMHRQEAIGGERNGLSSSRAWFHRSVGVIARQWSTAESEEERSRSHRVPGDAAAAATAAAAEPPCRPPLAATTAYIDPAFASGACELVPAPEPPFSPSFHRPPTLLQGSMPAAEPEAIQPSSIFFFLLPVLPSVRRTHHPHQSTEGRNRAVPSRRVRAAATGIGGEAMEALPVSIKRSERVSRPAATRGGGGSGAGGAAERRARGPPRPAPNRVDGMESQGHGRPGNGNFPPGPAPKGCRHRGPGAGLRGVAGRGRRVGLHGASPSRAGAGLPRLPGAPGLGGAPPLPPPVPVRRLRRRGRPGRVVPGLPMWQGRERPSLPHLRLQISAVQKISVNTKN